jgi:hypothetical protein
MHTSTIKEHFTGNQALGLLWINEKKDPITLELTKEELRHLQLIVIDEFVFIDSPYMNKLVSKVKSEILPLMLRQEPIFK